MNVQVNAQTFAGFPPDGSAHCPMCKYDLSGLPAEHQCPECGFAYDAHTRVWHDRLTLATRICFAVSASFCLFAGLGSLTLGSTRTGPLALPFVAYLGEILLIVAAILFALVAFRTHKPRPFVVIARDGFHLHVHLPRHRLYPWHDIESADLKRGLFGAMIRLHRHEKHPIVFPIPFLNKQEKQQLVDTVNAYIETLNREPAQ